MSFSPRDKGDILEKKRGTSSSSAQKTAKIEGVVGILKEGILKVEEEK